MRLPHVALIALLAFMAGSGWTARSHASAGTVVCPPAASTGSVAGDPTRCVCVCVVMRSVLPVQSAGMQVDRTTHPCTCRNSKFPRDSPMRCAFFKRWSLQVHRAVATWRASMTCPISHNLASRICWAQFRWVRGAGLAELLPWCMLRC